MNEGQEKFLNFILERAQEDKVEKARSLLADHFRKQAEDSYTKDDISQFASQIIPLLKPEKAEEVQSVMKQFAQKFEH
jgi:hypothetical protein